MKIRLRNVIGLTAAGVVATATSFAQPIITAQPADQFVLLSDNTTFSVSVAGTGLFNYQWESNGIVVPNNIITTIAGGTFLPPPFVGDNGPATNAFLNNPGGVAVDNQGNVFIADTRNNRIRRVGINGIITTVAGTNRSGFSGDGGMATNAELANVAGLAIDSFGDLFIADFGNNRIRMVTPSGYIFTVAGGGTSGPNFDGPATEAQLNGPNSVAVDANGILYIADSNNYRVRKVAYGTITTVAGGGTNSLGDGGPATEVFLDPTGVAVDDAGNLFIADVGRNRIRKVDTNGIITTVAGGGSAGLGDGGQATNAILNAPVGLALDTAGDLFILDGNDVRIRMVDTNGIVTTVAGSGNWGYAGDSGPAIKASFGFFRGYTSWDSGVAVDKIGNLYIGDTSNNRVREVGFGGLPMLTIQRANPRNACNYQVIVSNSSGSITSSMATLTLVTPPTMLISNVVGGVGGLTLFMTTTPNVSSRVYAASDLAVPVNWQPIYTNTTGGVWQFTDTNAPGSPAQYYRVSTP